MVGASPGPVVPYVWTLDGGPAVGTKDMGTLPSGPSGTDFRLLLVQTSEGRKGLVVVLYRCRSPRRSLTSFEFLQPLRSRPSLVPNEVRREG